MINAGYNYPAVQRGGSTASSQSDWLATPALSIPDRPNDGQPGEFCAASPMSSPGASTPSNGDSWNIFDDNFRKSIEPSPVTSPTMEIFDNTMLQYPQKAPQQIWSSTWSPDTNSQGPASSYLPLSMIYEPTTACEGGDGEQTENSVYPYQPLETYEGAQSLRKAAWGSAKHSRRASESSKSDRHSPRSKRRNSSSRTESISSNVKGHQLRSTKQGQRISYTEPDTKDDALKGPRASHNMVEKVRGVIFNFLGHAKSYCFCSLSWHNLWQGRNYSPV